MFSWPLFKMSFKNNGVLLIIFFLVLAMYMTIIQAMFDPDDMEAIASMLDLFPEDVMKAMGFSSLISDLVTYLASWLYSFLMFGFPMVYCIILANRLVARMVDNHSFVYLLSTPNSRVKLILTQAIYALLSLIVLFISLFSLGLLVAELLYPGLLDIMAFFRLNLTTLLVNSTVMMIAFFFSCLFNEARRAVGLAAAVPIAFLLMNMLGGISEEAAMLKSLSIYGFYDPVDLVQGSIIWPVNLIYILVTVLLFTASILVFNKKRLPL